MFIGVPAQWTKYDNSAGPIRNALMVDPEHMGQFLPERVVAFPGGPGTANMCKLAHYAGIPVIYARP